jgi:hypothetical protein
MTGDDRSRPVDESSPRYPGWRVVLACFLVEIRFAARGMD